ncbi:sugar translocase [Halobacillus fulvus]|nr:sugar translocase [Halobacillus fulvus]
MNREKKNSIAVNIFHLFYSTAFSSGLNAVALILLAGYLQTTQYGLFSVALAFSMIMCYFTDAGLSHIVLREGAKQVVSLPALLSSYIKFRSVLLVLTFLLGFLTIHLMNSGQKELIMTSYLLIIPMVTGVALQSIGMTFFRLIEKMEYLGFIRMISAVLLVGSIGIGMLFKLHPFLVITFYGGSYLAAGIFGMMMMKKFVAIQLHHPFHKGLFQNIGAFTVSGLLFVLLPQLGPIVLEKTITLAEVGLFAVAYRIPQALQQIPFVVTGAYAPVLFKHFHGKRLDSHFEQLNTQLKIMGLIGMLMTIPFLYLSDFIVSLFFGEEWARAALPLSILALMLTFQSVNTALADGLTTVDKQTSRTLVQLVIVGIGIVLYMWLSRSYGVVGAAVAGMSLEALALIGFWLFTPERWAILRQTLLPYFSIFFISLWSIKVLLGDSPWIAMMIHLTVTLSIVVIDKDLRTKVIGIVNLKKRKIGHVKRIEKQEREVK